MNQKVKNLRFHPDRFTASMQFAAFDIQDIAANMTAHFYLRSLPPRWPAISRNNPGFLPSKTSPPSGSILSMVAISPGTTFEERRGPRY
jgi:hypothetical protein